VGSGDNTDQTRLNFPQFKTKSFSFLQVFTPYDLYYPYCYNTFYFINLSLRNEMELNGAKRAAPSLKDK